MTVMQIKDEDICLNGFDHVDKDAYIIFRDSGIELSPTEPTTILNVYHCTVEDGMIHDEEVLQEIIDRQYPDEIGFIWTFNTYISA